MIIKYKFSTESREIKREDLIFLSFNSGEQQYGTLELLDFKINKLAEMLGKALAENKMTDEELFQFYDIPGFSFIGK